MRPRVRGPGMPSQGMRGSLGVSFHDDVAGPGLCGVRDGGRTDDPGFSGGALDENDLACSRDHEVVRGTWRRYPWPRQGTARRPVRRLPPLPGAGLPPAGGEERVPAGSPSRPSGRWCRGRGRARRTRSSKSDSGAIVVLQERGQPAPRPEGPYLERRGRDAEGLGRVGDTQFRSHD